MGNRDLEFLVVGLIVIVLSTTLHEFGHAISADRLGDPTPRQDGRITLWPDKHFDPFGFLMMCVTLFAGVGIGWGKPVMVQTRNFKNPRRDMMIVAAFGPLMNLLLAVVFGLLLRLIIATGQVQLLGGLDGFSVVGKFLIGFVTINLSLMFFNLIPVHPLDGSKILGGILPPAMADWYDRTVAPFGFMVLLLFAFAGRGILGGVIGPAVDTVTRVIVGM